MVELTGSSNIPHLGEFLRPLVHFPELETIEIWANSIGSFAGLWGVGFGSIFLPKLRFMKLRVSPRGFQNPRAVFAANPPDKVVDAFAGPISKLTHLLSNFLPVTQLLTHLLSKFLPVTCSFQEDVQHHMSLFKFSRQFAVEEKQTITYLLSRFP